MAVLRNFRFGRRNKFVANNQLPTGIGPSPAASASAMMNSSLTSSTSSTSSSSSNSSSASNGGGIPNSSMKQKNGELLGIERSNGLGNGTAPIIVVAQNPPPRKQAPRFFFWTLSLGADKKKANRNNKGSLNSSSPSTPDSSRSVSFEDAETWPWIDDEMPCDGQLCLEVV